MIINLQFLALPQLAALSNTDQLHWQVQKFGRRCSEALVYQLQRLLSFAPQGEAPEPPDWLESLLLWLVRGVLVFFVLTILYQLVKLSLPWLRRQQRAITAQPDEVSELRSPHQYRVSEWLEQAHQAQLQANYALACRSLYMALLLQLEIGGWLTQDLARTDGEYLHKLELLWIMGKQPIHLRDAFYQIFQIHEQVCYGRQTVTAEMFYRCQAAYDRLEPALLSSPAQNYGSR